MSEISKVSFNAMSPDGSLKRTEVEIGLEHYREAADKRISLNQLLMQKYPVQVEVDNSGKVNYPQGTALEQFMASSGIRIRADEARGIPATSIRDIMYGHSDISMGTIVRPQTSTNNNIAGRVLFNEIILQLINEQLVSNKDYYLNPWEQAIAIKENVVGPVVFQPKINITAPEASANQPISQLAEPAVMVTITTSSGMYTIPTKSIGLQIADEATLNTGIDQVAIILASQARGERIRRIEEDMGNIINGDTDFGINPVTFVNATTFDAGVNATDKVTHRAWVKWLWSKRDTLAVTHILASEDAAIEVDLRKGKPTVFTDTSAAGNRFPGEYTVANGSIPAPTMLLLPSSIVGADRLVAFDRSMALRQITNINANYAAIENFVLRRAQAMRFDYGTALFKFMDQAFMGLTIGS